MGAGLIFTKYNQFCGLVAFALKALAKHLSMSTHGLGPLTGALFRWLLE
jgi:hypothetical protein